MIIPTSEQMVYIDLSQPDSVTILETAEEPSFFTIVKNIFANN